MDDAKCSYCGTKLRPLLTTTSSSTNIVDAWPHSCPNPYCLSGLTLNVVYLPLAFT